MTTDASKCKYCFRAFDSDHELLKHSLTNKWCSKIRTLGLNQCLCGQGNDTEYDLNIHKQSCIVIEIEDLKYTIEELESAHVRAINQLTSSYEAKIKELTQLLINPKKPKDDDALIEFDRDYIIDAIGKLTVEDVFVSKFEQVIVKILSKDGILMYKCLNDTTNMFVYRENTITIKDKNMVKLRSLIFKPLLSRIIQLVPVYAEEFNVDEEVQYSLPAKYKVMLSTDTKFVKTFKAYLIN